MSNEAYILYLFYLFLVPFFYFHFVLQVASRQVDVPAELIRSILCSNDIVKIMLLIYPLFLFWFWYSSCFDVKCWFHTFLNRYSHISMGVLILIDHQDGHVNPFQPVCLLFKLFHTDAVEKSDDLSVSFIPSCLVSPPSLPFCSWSQKFSDEVSILFMWYFFILPSMFLSGDLSWRWSTASSSSFFCSHILLRWM